MIVVKQSLLSQRDMRQIVICQNSNGKKFLYNNGETFPVDTARRVLHKLAATDYPSDKYTLMTVALPEKHSLYRSEWQGMGTEALRRKSETWSNHFELTERIVGTDWKSDIIKGKRGEDIHGISQMNLMDGNGADVTIVWGVLENPYKDDSSKSTHSVFCAAIQTSGFIPYGCTPLIYLHEWELLPNETIPTFTATV